MHNLEDNLENVNRWLDCGCLACRVHLAASALDLTTPEFHVYAAVACLELHYCPAPAKIIKQALDAPDDVCEELLGLLESQGLIALENDVYRLSKPLKLPLPYPESMN